MIIDSLRDLIQNNTSISKPDVSEGSPLGDLVLGSMSMILQSMQDQYDNLESTYSLQDATRMSEEALDKIAANFLQERSLGGKSAGYIVLLYETAQTISIPAGTVFSFNNLDYVTTEQYNITSTAMSQNISYSYFSTGAIAVTASAVGSIFNFTAGASLTTVFTPAPVNVIAISDFTGGSDKETNAEFYARILNNAKNFNAGTPDGLAAILRYKFPTIKDIAVVGAGSELMQRDIVIDKTNRINTRGVVDFYGKTKEAVGTNFPKHVAYSSSYALDTTVPPLAVSGNNADTLATLPLPNDDSVFAPECELTTDQYSVLYDKTTSSITTSTSVLINETFTDNVLSDWDCIDNVHQNNGPFDENEFKIVNGKVRLGYTSTSINSVILTADDIVKFASYIGMANGMPHTRSSTSMY